MLRNISGPHIQRADTDDAKALFGERLGCIKICDSPYVDLVKHFHDVNSESPVCCRLIDDSANFDNMRELTQKAIRLFQPLLPVLGPDLLWVEILPNEKYCNGEELKRLSANTAICAQDVADAGMRPVGFNLPVGNPADIAQAAYMLEGVEALNRLRGAVGYHNYTIPDKQLDVWLDLRHEQMATFLPPETKWWLNEGLYDHGIVDGRLYGWRFPDWHLNADNTAAYVQRIASHLAQDSRVIGWTPFGAGPTQDWIDKGFQYDNESIIVEQLSKYYEVEVPVPPTPPVEYQPQIMLGIDISSNNGPNVDLSEVYSVGRTFALIKCSEIYRNSSGQVVRYINEYFDRWWVDCANNNLVRGAYIYGRPAVASPVDTVELFDEAIQRVGGFYRGDIPMLDSEEDGPDVFNWTLEILDVLVRKYGTRPLWYTSPDYISRHNLNHPEIAKRCRLMLASWGKKPATPSAFERLDAWQFSATGRVFGVPGDCDEDVFFGALDQLIAIGVP